MSSNREFLGIFQGGGLRGLAHVAALRVAEKKEIGSADRPFHAVAGTSAGAIVAALVAAGYTAKELYNDDGGGLFDADFYRFFTNISDWRRLDRLYKDLENPLFRYFVNSYHPVVFFVGLLVACLTMPFFYLRHHRLLGRLLRKQGMFDTGPFEAWLELRLQEKLGAPSQGASFIRFSDLRVPLKVIATDVTRLQVRVFGHEPGDETLRVAKAVCASIAIPFLFCPVRHDGYKYLDGGIVSNLPAWAFDDERRSATGAGDNTVLETLAFQLSSISDNVHDPFDQFARKVLASTLQADEHLHVRQVDNLYLIPLKVDADLVTFLTGEEAAKERRQLYIQAHDSASKFFDQFIRPRTGQSIDFLLKTFSRDLRELLLKLSADNGVKLPADPHLRVNVFLPVRNAKDEVVQMRLFFSHNMESDMDTDDRMVFSPDCGGIGRCWKRREPLVFDLDKAKQVFRTEYRMTKYEQAMVRQDLRSLLCVPIFNLQPSERKDLVGILCFDSKDDLLSSMRLLLEDSNHSAVLANWAKVVATILPS